MKVSMFIAKITVLYQKVRFWQTLKLPFENGETQNKIAFLQPSQPNDMNICRYLTRPLASRRQYYH